MTRWLQVVYQEVISAAVVFPVAPSAPTAEGRSQLYDGLEWYVNLIMVAVAALL